MNWIKFASSKAVIKPRETTLRSFGLIVGAAFLLLSVAVLYKGGTYKGAALSSIGVILASLAALRPLVLDLPERLWSKLGLGLSVVATHVILTLLYIFLIIPMSLILKLVSKDLLLIKKTGNTTYWQDVEADGPHSRLDVPY